MERDTEKGGTDEGAQRGALSPRRRFLKHGLAGGSVALLASTHRAMAGGCVNPMSYSGYTSFVANPATSATPGHFSCGLSPGYWAPPGNPLLHQASWPIPMATLFTAKFGSSYPAYGASGLSSSSTFFQVISNPGMGNCARQFAAAYLDALANGSFPETTTNIVAFWQANYLNAGQLAAYIAYLATVET